MAPYYTGETPSGHQATGPRGKGTALVQAGNAGVNWQGCDLLVSYFLNLLRNDLILSKCIDVQPFESEFFNHLAVAHFLNHFPVCILADGGSGVKAT